MTLRLSFVITLVCIALAGCIGRETDPRQMEDAVGDAVARDTTVAGLEARVDSLERTVAAIIEQYGAQYGARTTTADDVVQEPATGHQGPSDAEEPAGAAVPAPARAPRPAAVDYATYRNERLGYTIDYPANVMAPAEVLGDGNGQRFATADGSAVLAVYGVEGVGASSLRNLYEEELQDPNRRVTYKTLHDDWFVISGYAGDQVFYERTLLRGDVLKTFLLIYDAESKEYFDPITEHISFSFEG